MTSSSQQHLSYEQIHHLVHMDSIVDDEEVHLQKGSRLTVHYTRIQVEGRDNPFPDLADLQTEIPDFGERLNLDVKWCIRMLESLKSLSIRAYTHDSFKFQALVTAMTLNNPRYVLQELRVPAGSENFRLITAAASFTSLQYCTLENHTVGPVGTEAISTIINYMDIDMGFRQIRQGFSLLEIPIPRKFLPESQNIWHVGFSIPETPNMLAMFGSLCNNTSRIRSIALLTSSMTDLFIRAAKLGGLPRNLEHLQLTSSNSDSWPNIGEFGLGEVIEKTRRLRGNFALTSLKILLPHDYPAMMDTLLGLRYGISSLSIEACKTNPLRNSVKILPESLLTSLEGSSLRHLFILKWAKESFLPNRDDQLKLVDFLNRHIDCPLETIEGLDWADMSLERNCMEILRRNKIYRDGALFTEPQMPPTTAKLIICGDSGVGKSTLRKNLTRRLCIPACLQFSKSTIGIRVATLTFGKNTLVLWDLAGQPEFHTLHHYFVGGSDKDLFLLVCKAPSANVVEDPSANPVSRSVQNQLRYWLRFIVAHRSLSARKPKVLILLNYFPDSVREIPRRLCQNVIHEYSDQVDFENAGVYEIDAKSFQEVQTLKPTLRAALTSLIESQPKVPELCKELIRKMNSSPRPKIMSVAGFKTLYRVEYLYGLKLKACITYLHDIGEVVYLVSDEVDELGTKEEAQLFIIVDVQWFFKDLIGNFLPRLPREVAARHVGVKDLIGNFLPRLPREVAARHVGAFDHRHSVDELKAKLQTECDHADYILFCLERMGITLTEGDPGSRDNKVTILPLLQNTVRNCNWVNEECTSTSQTNSYSYWGRRFDCKDSDRRLLPFGIFNMLQVKLAGSFSKTDIGKGWLYLVENRIHIIVKIGGTRGEWYDNHWVDVLVRIPFDPDHYFLETGEQLFQQVQKSLHELCGKVNWGCPSLELEEKVISLKFVEQGPSEDFSNVEVLSKIMEKLKEKDMLYYYTWPFENETTQMFRLLLPSERDAYFNHQRGALEELSVEVRKCLDTDSKMPMEDDDDSEELSQDGRILRKVIQRFESRIMKEFKGITSELQRLELVVRKQMEDIQLQIFNLLSELQFHLEFELPKHFYITDDKNRLQRISKLAFGSTSKVYFLCDHNHGSCHLAVEHQKGIRITTPPEWFKKMAPVLIPTLKILCLMAKIVTVAGLGVLIPTPEPAFFEGLKDKTIDAVCEEIFDRVDDRVRCSRADLEQFYAHLDLKGKDLGAVLGLYRSIRNGKHVWLCQKHHSLPSSSNINMY